MPHLAWSKDESITTNPLSSIFLFVCLVLFYKPYLKGKLFHILSVVYGKATEDPNCKYIPDYDKY